MTFHHDAAAALPQSGIVRNLLRALLYRDVPYVLADDANPEDLIGVDPETGAAIIDILYRGRLFHYDATDTETPNDGVTTLVIDGGRRYKLDDLRTPKSVFDKDLTEPPAEAAVGDTYLLMGAPAGDWATFSIGSILYLSARGWESIDAAVGASVYVRDEGGYYHRNEDGDWVAGFGATPLSLNSVPLSAAINFGARLIVENSTTNSPPADPEVGVAYICGSSSVSPFVANKIAICEVAGSFTIYDPKEGWTAYDKNLNQDLRFDGSAWISAAGTWIDRRTTPLTTSGSTTAPLGTNLYVYSLTTPPTTSQRRLIDTVTLSFAAKKTDAVLRFEYTASITTSAGGSLAVSDCAISVALFRDSGSSAIAWCTTQSGITASSVYAPVSAKFEVTAPDASSHTYTIALLSGANGTSAQYVDATNLGRRLFTVQEAA